MQRGENQNKITALTNVSGQKIDLEIEADLIKNGNGNNLKDIISGQNYTIKNNILNLNIDPYQNIWLTTRRY